MKLKIKFKLNKRLDKDMALEFLNVKTGGIDFSQGIISVHPKLEKILNEEKEEQKRTIDRYFDEYYKNNSQYLNACVVKMQKDWEKDEDKFIGQLEKIFKNPEVPKGDYTGYVSIINCNPRFLENKTFQVFHEHTAGANYVTAHEVLHFFFYDYAERKYPEIFGNLDKNSGIFWDLSELFNIAVMSGQTFISEYYPKNTKPYPVHLKYCDTVKEIWNKTRDIDTWIVDAYKYISK